MKKKITILVPAYNESASLRELLVSLQCLSSGVNEKVASSPSDPSSEFPDMTEYDWEFLFVNDGSDDDTLKILLDARKDDSRINVVSLSRNFGKENAMLAGFDFATGDAVIIMDADMQHPVELIPEMVMNWEKGWDDVYGVRKERGKEPFVRKVSSKAFYHVFDKLSDIDIPGNAGDFRLLDRRVVAQLKKLRENTRYTKGLYSWVGFRKKAVPFATKDRYQAKSSFRLKSLVNHAMDGITSFSITPLRLSMLLGFVVSLLAIVYIAFIIVKTLIYGEPVRGFPTIMCAILFLGGVQLISIGIIGEYIGKIFTESKDRPVYIADSYNGEKL